VGIHLLQNEVLLIDLRMGCGDLTQTLDLGNPHGMMEIVGAVVGAFSKHNLGIAEEKNPLTLRVPISIGTLTMTIGSLWMITINIPNQVLVQEGGSRILYILHLLPQIRLAAALIMAWAPMAIHVTMMKGCMELVDRGVRAFQVPRQVVVLGSSIQVKQAEMDSR
jgi:hypothetical protein